jgi:hypothetical protein
VPCYAEIAVPCYVVLCCAVLCAEVVAVGHDVDLALLTVEDDDFWVGTEGAMKPLKLGDVPQLQVCTVCRVCTVFRAEMRPILRPESHEHARGRWKTG